MFKRYFDRAFRMVFGSSKDDSIPEDASDFRYPALSFRLRAIPTKKQESTIYGTDSRWAAVNSKISSDVTKKQTTTTESQENIVDLNPAGILGSLDITSERRSVDK